MLHSDGHTTLSMATQQPLRGSDCASTFFYGLAGGSADALGLQLVGSFAGHITGNLVLLLLKATTGTLKSWINPFAAVIIFTVATEVGIILSKKIKAHLNWVLFAIQCGILTAGGLAALLKLHGMELFTVTSLCLCLGLQNGAISSVAGVAVHSSYMTGNVTRFLKALSSKSGSNLPIDSNTVVLSGTVLAGFVLGVALAVWAKRSVGIYPPTFLIAPLFAAALASSNYWRVRQSTSTGILDMTGHSH